MKKSLLMFLALILMAGCIATQNNVKTAEQDAAPETIPGISMAAPDVKGGIFLTGFFTAMEYDNVAVRDKNGRLIFADNFAGKKSEWQGGAEWVTENGTVKMEDSSKFDSRYAIYNADWEASIITVKGRKTGGKEGICLGFGAKGSSEWYQFNAGGWGNTRTVLQKAGEADAGVIMESYEDKFTSIPADEPVELKVVMEGKSIKCYINNDLVIDYFENKNRVIPQPAADEFLNPANEAVQMPDPFVLKHTDGYYYGMHTVMDAAGYSPKLVLYKDKTLSGLYTKGEKKFIFEAPKGQGEWNSADIWAPELYNFDGVWYVYYSLSNFKIGVISNSNANPMEGQWKDEGQILSDEGWAIDASIFKQNNKMYLIWSGIPAEGMQRIYIQEMESPTKVKGVKLELSKPEFTWERRGTKEIHDVNEGPVVLQRNGKTFIMYSASFCVSPFYCLGMLTCDITADPMAKSSWKKSDKPVFETSAENGIWAPGHNGFTQSPDGTEDWIVYHAMMKNTVGGSRVLLMQKFTWNEDGTPNFGIPSGRYEPIKKPSGE